MGHMMGWAGAWALCVFMVVHLHGVRAWWAHVIRLSYGVSGVALALIAAGWGAVSDVDDGFLLTLALYALALMVLRRRQTLWTQAGTAVIALGMFSMSVVLSMLAYGAVAP